MSDTKNRDVAKELVDFLLKKEDQGKTTVTEAPKQDMAAPPPAQVDIPMEFEWDEALKPAAQLEPIKIEEGQTLSSKGSEKPSVAERIPETKLEFANKSQALPQTQGQAQSERGRIVFNEVNSLIGGTEAVRVAQARIATLEKERDNLRDETEKLLVSTENLQRRLAEFKSQNESLERKYKQKVDILEEEKAVLQGRLSAREQELNLSRKTVDELESRFKNDLKRIRVRERELENRNELLKIEMHAVVKSKDDLILELKRQIEQVGYELDNFKARSTDLDSKINEFHERNYRTVKALRLALTVLEAGDNDERPKKATG